MNKHPVSHSLIQTRPQKYILLTGATGLVGRYLMRDLFLQGRQLAVIVRPHKKLSVEQRVESILQMWEKQLGFPLPRPVVFEGDVAEPDLGLDQEALEWISVNCSEVIHNAAVLQFVGTGFENEPWRTNLGGTQNVLEICRRCEIRNLSYVSTAYVCGERRETVYEDDLDRGQQFRNDYERSKFEAELLVKQAEGFERKTIFRPAVIVGDSRTGYTSTYHGLFLYLRLLATLVPQQKTDASGTLQTPIQLPLSGDEPRNLVPVDWVSSVITYVSQTPEIQNRTYHLVPDKCSTARDVINACYEYFNSDGVVYCGADYDRAADNEFAQRFFDNARVYESYETSDPHFDKSNVQEFVGHLPCPPIDKKAIIRFMEFGQSDNWGKRRTQRPQVSRWFSSQLPSVVEGAQRIRVADHLTRGQKKLRIGLDIYGPGGGQWKLTACDKKCEITQGLPIDEYRLLKMDDLQVAKLVSSDIESSTAWANKLESVLTSAEHE